MKKINFTNTGGFPLEQETLARLQAAYRDELYEMLKGSFGIQDDQNYIISEPTSTEDGWFVIRGILHVMNSGATPTNFIKTTESTIGLRFGDGIYHPAYTDYVVAYVNAIPVEYDVNDPDLERDGEKDLTILAPNERRFRYYDITNTGSNPNGLQQIGFLPIDGSKPMEGNLDMGGNKLSNVDTLPSEFAILRSKLLLLGNPDAADGLGFPGTALVDENIDAFIPIDARPVNPEATALHLNYNSNWGTTVIGGELKLPEFAENSTSSRKSPLLIDARGNVCKGSASENIPLGLIALWYDTNNPIPLGWRLCNAANAGVVGGITIPNLENNTVGIADAVDTTTPDIIRYIIYVGRDTPAISAVIIDAIRNSKSITKTLSSGEIAFDATAAPFELNATLENLTLQGWSQVSGPSGSTITTPNSVSTDITGSLIIGTYVYQVTGVDALGAEFMDEVTIIIRRSNIPPVFNSVVNTLTNANITNDMDITITSQLLTVTEQQAQNIVAVDLLRPALGGAQIRVSVSDPDGNIFNASLIARVLKSDGSVNIVLPLELSQSGDVVSALDSSINQLTDQVVAPVARLSEFRFIGLEVTDRIQFVVTDEGGEVTTKEYGIIVNIEPSISILSRNPIPVILNQRGELFTVRVQGAANTTASLTIASLQSNVIDGEVTVSNTGALPDSFVLSNVNQVFNVALGTTGIRDIQVRHVATLPPVSPININTEFIISSRVSLANNSSNGVTLRSSFIIGLIAIDDLPDDNGDGPTGGGGGGGGGGGDEIIAEDGNDFPQNQL